MDRKDTIKFNKLKNPENILLNGGLPPIEPADWFDANGWFDNYGWSDGTPPQESFTSEFTGEFQ